MALKVMNKMQKGKYLFLAYFSLKTDMIFIPLAFTL